MSGTPRTSTPGDRQRPAAARIVLGTVLVSVAVVVAGYLTGLVLGHLLL